MSAERPTVSRRQVLRGAVMGAGVAGVMALGTSACQDQREDGAARRTGQADVRPQRSLVVIELGGGNDAWSTLVPADSGRYHDLRPTLALPDDEVVPFADQWALNQRLSGLAGRGLAVVQGVGTAHPNLSHFEMFERWHHGVPDPQAARSVQDAPPTGFLGRLCDSLGSEGALTGISLGWGDHPSLRCATAGSVGLGANQENPFADPTLAASFSELMRSFAVPAEDTYEPARDAIRGITSVLDVVSALPQPGDGYPSSALGEQLSMASRLLMSGHGIRVIHVPMGAATFDTHARHAETHGPLLVELDEALSAFLDDLRGRGAGEEVLVATTSEFGRRPRQNGDGLDHGAASVMLLAGPVVAGAHGEPSPIHRFDADDNLIATVEFDRYYATLASWLQVDPAQVLAARGTGVPVPIGGVLAG